MTVPCCCSSARSRTNLPTAMSSTPRPKGLKTAMLLSSLRAGAREERALPRADDRGELAVLALERLHRGRGGCAGEDGLAPFYGGTRGEPAGTLLVKLPPVVTGSHRSAVGSLPRRGARVAGEQREVGTGERDKEAQLRDPAVANSARISSLELCVHSAIWRLRSAI